MKKQERDKQLYVSVVDLTVKSNITNYATQLRFKLKNYGLELIGLQNVRLEIDITIEDHSEMLLSTVKNVGRSRAAFRYCSCEDVLTVVQFADGHASTTLGFA